MTVIYAAPETTRINVAGEAKRAYDLQSAINRAEPGDEILLSPGVYAKPVVVAVRGVKGAPITIRPMDPDRVRIDGRRLPEQGLSGGLEPMDDDWAFFKLFRAAHIRLEGLTIRNCWPQVVYMRGCEDVAFRGFDVEGARYVVFARSAPGAPGRGYLLEGIRWIQDPDFTMWRGETRWREVKRKRGLADKSWFNGALFGSFDILGEVTIRGCDVRHAFNAVRMDIREERVNTCGEPEVERNRDVRIHHNRFAFIRDNAVEPEMGAQGWLIAENLFLQVHATLSLDGVTTRDLAFVSNRILNLDRGGDISNNGGKIIKFLGLPEDVEGQAPRRAAGLVVAQNSIRTRTRYVSDAQVKPWVDANNAVERFAAADRDDEALFSKVIWSKSAEFRGLATNDPDYPPDADPASFDGYDPLANVVNQGRPTLSPNDPWGGWTGDLPLSAAAERLPGREVEVRGPGGLQATVLEGGPVGYRPLVDLGLDGWVEPPRAVA